MRVASLSGPFGALTLHAHAGGAASSERVGGLVFFHGGGATGASFASASAQHASLADAGGCRVLAVDSALLSKPSFPQVVDEAYFAVCHLHELAEDFGVDHRRIAVGGEGFGATLAAAVGRLAKQRRNPAIALQLLLDPYLDLRAPDPSWADFVERYLPDADQRSDPRASPGLATNLIGLPPACLITSRDDEQRAAADTYAAALRRAYVQVDVVHARGPHARADALDGGARALRAALGA
jgi:acetyl esterase